MRKNVFSKLLTFLSDLEQSGIDYTLAHHRDETIMGMVAVPGERWEIEFLDDGSVEVERFVSSGDICGEEALNELLARYSDQGPNGLKTLQDLNWQL